MTAGTPPDFGSPPAPPKKPFQFRLWELLLFMAAASGCMFLSAPLVRQFNSIVAAILLESAGIGLFAILWWKVRTRKWTEAAVVAGVMFVLTALLLPARSSDGRQYARMSCQNNLKMIVVAMHSYHDRFGSLPPAYIADENGKPMHSWRVLLLPFMEQEPVYEQYDFSEPWDGPNNIRLAPMINFLYECRTDSRGPGMPSQTSYLAITGRGTMWPGAKPARFDDVTDGLSNVIAVVEVHNSGVQTTEPRDLDISQMPLKLNPKSGLGISSGHARGANIVFADGSVHYLAEGITKETLLKLLIIDNGSPTPDDY